MSIPTRTSLDRLRAGAPDSHLGASGVPRPHARAGDEYHRAEVDGSRAVLDPTSPDLLIFAEDALTACQRFATGDWPPAVAL